MLKKEDIKVMYLEKAQSLQFFAAKFVDCETAEDIVQDAFLKLWTVREKLSPSSNLNSYLFQMVKNACIDSIRHDSVRDKIVRQLQFELKMEEITYYTENNYVIENEKIEKINQLIDKLPIKCKEIFVAAYLDGKGNKEIASELNISVRTVDAQIYKALSFLRKNILSLSSLFFFCCFLAYFE